MIFFSIGPNRRKVMVEGRSVMKFPSVGNFEERLANLIWVALFCMAWKKSSPTLVSNIPFRCV